MLESMRRPKWALLWAFGLMTAFASCGPLSSRTPAGHAGADAVGAAPESGAGDVERGGSASGGTSMSTGGKAVGGAPDVGTAGAGGGGAAPGLGGAGGAARGGGAGGEPEPGGPVALATRERKPA